jgi:hypothetical protein
MANDWDGVKQAQAYLLSEADVIRSKIRQAPNNLGVRVLRSSMLVTTENSGSSPSTNVNSKRERFFDLPDEFTNSLQPEIKVYKTYIDDDGTEHDYLLPMGEYLGRVPNSDGVGVETTRGVVVKSVEFTRLGGNPAEIDTNIKFNIKLFAQNITTFFIKNEISPVVPYTPLASEELVFQSGRLEDLRTRAETAPNDTTRAGEVPYAQQRYDRVKSSVDAMATSEAAVGPNGERRTAWIDLIKIDPGQPLNDGEGDTALVTSENQVRIKVEIGYATPNAKPISYNGNDWQEWAEVIENQKEVFYLSLFKHNFDFKGYDGVELSIDYIASGNALQLSPEADLFSNPEIQKKLTNLRANLRDKEDELKKAGDQEGDTTDITKTCMEGIVLSIETIEGRIREINASNKLRLLNQIYLSGNFDGTSSTSRLYFRVYDYQDSDSPIKNRQLNPEYSIVDSINATATDLSIAERDSEMRLSVIDEDWVTRDDDAEVAATTSLRGTSRLKGHNRYSNHFIFLGDIIDAAYELLVPTATTTLTTTFTVDSLITRERTLEYDRHFHPAIDSGTTEAQAARIETITSLFGGLIGAWVTYKNPNNITKDKTIPIRDIPIALDIFRAWWLNNYAKSNRNTLGIKDFIVQLMKFVETDVFKNIPLEYGTNEDTIETPKFIINSATSNKEFLTNLYNEATLRPRGKVSEETLNSALTGLTSGFSVLLIEQSNNNPKWNELTANITFGETSKGILKKVNFEREDIPGHAEARLFSDRTSVAGNIALREKYNTKLDLIGTTSLTPGSLFYLDPLPLDLGWSQTEKKSFARQLGLGGMYRVVNLTSNMDFASSGNTWKTTVNTKWESFGDGHNGISEVAREEAIGTCAELEAGEIDAAAPLPETLEQFSQRMAEEQASAFYIDPGEGKRSEDVVPLGLDSVRVPE